MSFEAAVDAAFARLLPADQVELRASVVKQLTRELGFAPQRADRCCGERYGLRWDGASDWRRQRRWFAPYNPYVAICSSCGRDNPAGFKFCPACGLPVGAAAPARGEERKVVSVLFCDLAGFTARSDQADPEDVRARLRPYHVRLRTEIERFGGTLDKFIGDGVMAVFGAPVAHEDDPERAVRAALRMLDAIRELNEANPALELSVRIGITTGEAVVSLAKGNESEGVVGDVVNTASRLEGVAPVGAVVVGEPTWRATRELFDYRALEPVSVKGKAEPLAVWQALAPRSRHGSDVGAKARTPYIGRKSEQQLLRHVFERSVAEQSVQLVTVTGEPGVGKSRLVSEFFAFIDNETQELVSWRQGRCLPYGEGITFWALGEIVKAEAGILESDGAAEAGAKLDAAVSRVPSEDADRDWMRARLAPLVGLNSGSEQAVERSESFTAWRRFLEGMAASGPLVLVVEDLHWGDPALLEFLEHLVDWTTGVPLLVLCTARPELYERHPAWSGGKRNSTTIALSALSDAETARLLAALLEQAVLPAEVQALLLERAGGNPLYAEEFVRMLADRGLLAQRGRSRKLLLGADIEFPDSLQALIAARLDTLAPERKALLQDAAVFGKVFWAGAVAAMGQLDPALVHAGLHELGRKELLRPARISSVAGEAEYSFSHALIRDVAYGQIPRTGRVAKHQAAAAWIEQLAGQRVADHAEVLASHYTRALELARAAGARALVTELEDPARRFLVMAGDRSMALDVVRALQYYRQALELVPRQHPDRATVLVKTAEALAERGSHDDADIALAEAIDDFLGSSRRLKAGSAMARRASVLWHRGQTARSSEVLIESIGLLEQERPSPELAGAYAHLAMQEMIAGRPQEALAWSDKVLRFDDVPNEAAVLAHSARGGARIERGDPGGLEDSRRALELALALGQGRLAMIAYGNLAEDQWPIEGPAASLQSCEAGRLFAEQRGMGSGGISDEMLMPLFDTGDWGRLRQIADDIIENERSTGGAYFGIIAELQKTRVQLYEEGVVHSYDRLESLLAAARAIGEPQILTPALVIGAMVSAKRNRGSAALELLRELDQAVEAPRFYHLNFLSDVVRVYVSVGEATLADALLTRTEASAMRHRHSVVTGRAVVAEARGNLDDAISLYADAEQRWLAFGSVPERGLALLGLGRSLQQLGRLDAKSKLREASDIFAALGARPLLLETETWRKEASA